MVLIYPVVLYNLFISPIDLCLVEEYISPYEALFLFASFVMLWYGLLATDGIPHSSVLSALGFHLFPLQVFLLLVFAQHQPVFAVLAALLIPALACILQKRLLEKIEVFHSFCSASFLVLLIPSIIAFSVYHLEPPKYKAMDQLWSQILTVDPSETDAAQTEDELKPFLELLDETQWDSLPTSAKLDAAQAVVTLECAKLEITTPTVYLVGLPDSVLGQYDAANEIIELSPRVLRATPEMLVTTLAHECRHKFQIDLVSSIDWTKPVSKSPYFQTALSWRNNQVSYISDGEKYFSQPIEADAVEFSTRTLPNYLPYISAVSKN